MRYLGFLLVCAVAVAGCQSGRVGEAQFSADGRVVAFLDSEYETVYLADENGVWRCGAGDFLLSPDGRLLLILERRRSWDPHVRYAAGHRVTLYDRSNHSPGTTKLPCDIPDYLLQVRDAGGSEAGQASNSARVARPPAFARVFFGPEARITIGPIATAYWSWTSDTGWTKTDRPPSTDQALYHPFLSGAEEPDAFALVELAADGWNPTRTVWVRPDGSTLELLRQNDLPRRIMGNVLYTPVAVHPFGLLNWLSEWSSIPGELTVDTRARDASRKELQRVIDERRAAHAQTHGN